MATKDEAVVVVAPLECRHTKDKKVYVARIRALGLTAYGKNRTEAVQNLKKMFATFTQLHRQSGTLEQRLKTSKLEWCYESEYQGDRPVEVLLLDGGVRTIAPKTPSVDIWQEPYLVVAC